MKYLTFLNSGCTDICKNMLLSAHRVGINVDNFYIACMDSESYLNLKHYKNCFLFDEQKIMEYQNWSFDPYSGFRQIVKNKWKLIKKIYKNNKELCWVDTDIVFKKNPEEVISNNDRILFQCDLPGSLLCSGFMVFNNTTKCSELIDECGNNDIEDDQILINNIALTKYKNNIALLNQDYFPNGNIYYNQNRKEHAYIIHNNHMIGIDTKISKFKEEGNWFL